MNYKLFTSESVSASHPDKICDLIADSILDECLVQDPTSRVAVETLVTANKVVLAGEITSRATVDFDKVVREVIASLGYTKKIFKFDAASVEIEVLIHSQSKDIASGVLGGGAGDQGMMFGFACRETQEFMPLPIILARAITRKMDTTRKNRDIPYLRPDGKSEVTVEYQKGRPKRVLKVITAVPHESRFSQKKVGRDIYEVVVKPTLKNYGFSINYQDTICNGTGKWEIGGPASDTGVTGRKIVVDTYGSMARIGGGCFSGKDPTKVDRSAAYAARFIAKNIVAKNLAQKCEVQLAYVIGKPTPISQAIETFGTESKPLRKIEQFAWNLLDLSVMGIIDGLYLRKPIYAQTASYGHFGHPNFSWEKIVP